MFQRHHIYIILGAVVLIVGGAIISATFLAQPKSPSPPVACTMDAKVCPDGTSVGRVPPKCDFARCPIWNEYFDERYGLSLSYPDWTEIRRHEEGFSVSSDSQVGLYFQIRISKSQTDNIEHLICEHLLTEEECKEFVVGKRFDFSYVSRPSGHRVITPTQIADNLKAFEVTTGGGANGFQCSYYFQKGDILYTVRLGNGLTRFCSEIFAKQVLASLKFSR